jgi:HD-like signal output (HDOD) protein
MGVAQRLPAVPRLLVDLGVRLNNPYTTSDDIVAILRQDPSLVSRIIQVANSVFQARVRPAASIEEAVAAVGFGEVHRLVGAVAAAQFGNWPLKLYGISTGRLRGYTLGLLRSIGKMALEQCARLDAGAPPFAHSGETALGVWETRQWGVDNCAVAERILTQWRLPAEAVRAVQHHYRPLTQTDPLVHLLSLATSAVHAMGYGLPGEEVYCQTTEVTLARTGLDARRCRAACERAQLTFDRLHHAVAA